MDEEEIFEPDEDELSPFQIEDLFDEVEPPFDDEDEDEEDQGGFGLQVR